MEGNLETFYAFEENVINFTQKHDILESQLSSNVVTILASLESIFANYFDQQENATFIFSGINVFGSSGNRLSLGKSDVDLDIKFIINYSFQDKTDILEQCSKAATDSKEFTLKRFVPNARVPVLNLIHNDSQTDVSFIYLLLLLNYIFFTIMICIEVDLCVNNSNGYKNTLLIRKVIEIDDRIRPFMLCVKMWAKCRGIANTKNSTLSSYAWVLLSIHFLQHVSSPIIPLLPCESDEENNSIIQNFKTTNSMKISELLKQFFYMYHGHPHTTDSFNYLNEVISIRFNKLDRMSCFQSTVSDKIKIKIPPDWRISIEDPYENHDLAGVIQIKEAMIFIQTEFKRAYELFGNSNDDELSFEKFIEINQSIPEFSMPCFRCQSIDHMASECPFHCCFHCQSPNHKIDNCPSIVCPHCQGNHINKKCPLQSVSNNQNTLTINESLELTVITWNPSQVQDESFISPYLSTIPNIFQSSNEWFETFPNFLLEELRAQLYTAMAKNIENSIKFYKMILIKEMKPDNKSTKKIKVRIDTELFYALKDSYQTIALLMKSNITSSSTSSDHFFSSENILCSIGGPVYIGKGNEIDPTTIVVTFCESNRASQFMEYLQSDKITNIDWNIYLLNVGYTSSSRIYDALCRRTSVLFMNDIITAKVSHHAHAHKGMRQGQMVAAPLPRPDGDIDTLISHLNRSQQEAIESVFQTGTNVNLPLIQIIKGPPGTGKTNTLVSLLRCLYESGLHVLACAPTNAAIYELLLRCCQVDEFPKRYADFIIVGRRNRLGIDETNPLFRYMHEDRVLRIDKTFSELQTVMNELAQLLKSSINDENKDRDDMTTLDNKFLNMFQDKYNLFLDYVLILQEELPGDLLLLCVNDHHLNAMKLIYNNIISSTIDDIILWLKRYSDEKDKYDSSVTATEFGASCSKFIDHMIRTVDTKNRPSASDVLNAAKIVFSTVNTAGRPIFRSVSFDIAVIDEATQLVQAETCIVFNRSLKCLVLAGDDKQLPSTVLSSHCQQYGYGTSLFSRLVSSGYKYNLLNIQYRMHPSISRWPNSQFYDGKLEDGANVISDSYTKEWHSIFPPIAIYDTRIKFEETNQFGSKYNEGEIIIIRQIIAQFKKLSSGPQSIAIISPYKEQVSRLECLSTNSSIDTNNDTISIRVSTIDSFQGQESDVVIFSTVRCNKKGKVGFLNDERRLNVAITRPRFCLLVIGDTETIKNDPNWNGFIQHVTDFGVCYNLQSSDIIKRANRKFKNEEKRLCDLSHSSSILENAEWKILCSNDFKVNLPKLPLNHREKVVNAVLNLAEGKRSKYTNKVAVILKEFENIIHVHDINEYQIIWSIDLQKESSTYTQCLKLWDVIQSGTTLLSKALHRVQNSLKSYSVVCLERLKYIQKSTTNDASIPKVLPMRWYENPALIDTFVQYKIQDSTNNNILPPSTSATNDKEVAQVDKSSALMKFYSLSSDTMKLLLKGRSDIDLPFVMSEEESVIINHPGSMFILGRSGTGKTTCMLRRMFIENQSAKKINTIEINNNTIDSTLVGKEESLSLSLVNNPRQLMVTASPILCSAIRKSYNKMCYTARLASSNTDINDINETYIDETFKPPSSILNCEDADFPLIITYFQLIQMLDADLQNPYFSKTQFLEKTDISDSLVDFYRFENQYYPHFDDKLRSTADPGLVFTEIMSHIKGSVFALKSIKGMLSLLEYKELSKQRHSNLNEYQRDVIYAAYLKYEKLKNQDFQEYDVCDLVRHIYHSHVHTAAAAAGGRRRGHFVSYADKITHVYVDEVQDLSPSQITLLKLVCQDPQGFVLAGDTAQTV